jgi:hypothetical protein
LPDIYGAKDEPAWIQICDTMENIVEKGIEKS